ncbi:MAG: hypothetical protein ACK502_02140 [Alphaproteobacteria bacterium]
MAENFIPDPVQQMSKVDLSQFKNLDDLIFNILDEGMNRISGLAKAIGAQSLNAVAAGGQALSGSSVNPMRGDYVSPSSSPETPEGSKIEVPNKERAMIKDTNPGQDASQLASGKTMQKSPSSDLVASVDIRDIGTLPSPAVFNGVIREESLVLGK